MSDMCRFKVSSYYSGWEIQMLFANTVLRKWVYYNKDDVTQENLFADVLRSLGHVVEEVEEY